MARPIAWAPQEGPQEALIDCPVYEIFYGGARGGGKTDGVLGKQAIKALTYKDAYNCVFFRRELPMLDDAIERSKQIYGPIGATWREQKKEWRFPGGGRLRFRPLESVSDAEKYQGQNLTDACIEEAGQYPDPAPIYRLHACLRSARGVPVQMHLTGNPGGPGQQWLKVRYVDPSPLGRTILREHLPDGNTRSRVYIPAKVRDNAILMQSDPNYVANLYMVGSAELVRAWLDGDWDAVEGAFFGEWSTRHVVEPRKLPAEWMRFRACDWGSYRPFSVGWYAVSDGSMDEFPRGALIKYNEWYGINHKHGGAYEPNIGVKMPAEEVADGIKERDDGANISYGVLDPACFSSDGGPSIAERMLSRGLVWRRADNRRVAGQGALGGWDQLRSRLKGDEGRPMIYFFSTCIHTIRTIPALQHDKNRPEDLDTEAEDHAADETRYGCMSRPYVRKVDSNDRASPDYRNIGREDTGIRFNQLRDAIGKKRREMA